MLSWSIATVLLIILIVLAFVHNRLRSRFHREQAKVARLTSKLAAVRKELAEIKTRRKKSFAASTEALVIIEKDYTISSANKVAKKLFGKPAKGTTLMAWTRQHRLQELVDQVLQGEKVPPLHFTLDDRILKAHTRFVKEDKEVVAVALAINDLTELQHLSHARRDFVANISHELRTPLASIQLLTDTLLKSALDDKTMALNLIDKIASQTDTLSQLAQELLDLSMIESGQTPLKMAPYSLKAIVQVQVNRLLIQAKRKNIDLHINIAPDVAVLVDETMIGRVITNLLHNSIKFTENGKITVSVQENNADAAEADKNSEEEWLTVSVSDTGIGTPPNEIDRIFERFYVTDRARNHRKSGTGLGLAIAKHIVEAHGGHIWAKSDGHSETTFYFTLPVEDRLPVKEISLPG